MSADVGDMVEWVKRWSQADDEPFHSVDRVGDEKVFDADGGVAELLKCWHAISEEGWRALGGALYGLHQDGEAERGERGHQPGGLHGDSGRISSARYATGIGGYMKDSEDICGFGKEAREALMDILKGDYSCE